MFLSLSLGPGPFELHQLFRESVFPVGVVKQSFGEEAGLLVLHWRGKGRWLERREWFSRDCLVGETEISMPEEQGSP